ENPEELEKYLKHYSVPRTILDSDGNQYQDYILRVYQDYFVPAIALSLAAQYFHVNLDEIEIEFGEAITIPNPKVYNPETGLLEAYRIMTRKGEYDPNSGELLREAQYKEVPEIVIPIDDQGQMFINYVGQRSSEVS